MGVSINCDAIFTIAGTPQVLNSFSLEDGVKQENTTDDAAVYITTDGRTDTTVSEITTVDLTFYLSDFPDVYLQVDHIWKLWKAALFPNFSLTILKKVQGKTEIRVFRDCSFKNRAIPDILAGKDRAKHELKIAGTFVDVSLT